MLEVLVLSGRPLLRSSAKFRQAVCIFAPLVETLMDDVGLLLPVNVHDPRCSMIEAPRRPVVHDRQMRYWDGSKVDSI